MLSKRTRRIVTVKKSLLELRQARALAFAVVLSADGSAGSCHGSAYHRQAALEMARALVKKLEADIAEELENADSYASELPAALTAFDAADAAAVSAGAGPCVADELCQQLREGADLAAELDRARSFAADAIILERKGGAS